MTLAAAYAIPLARSPGFVAGRDIALVLVFALAVRIAAFNGAFGSDDLTYYQRAAELARGEWTSANYNGALRYGFNLPAAGFMALFGPSVFSANLWPLMCSLIEIGAVHAFASSAMNRRAGICASLLLAAAPLHIAVATRIHADPIVSMFLTVGFVLLYFGAVRGRPVLLFAAGLAVGGVFWAKELAAVTWIALMPMLWLFRGQWRNGLYVVAGTGLMLLLHGVLMNAIAGDPLHLVKVVSAAVKRNFIQGGQGEDGAFFYFRYLFLDIRHLGLLAFLAAVAVFLVPRWASRTGGSLRGFHFTLIWWIGLVAVLSVFPVSLSPLRFTLKQSNYITLFLAPTAVLAGMAIAAMPRLWGRLALALSVALGLLLGLLQQADYRAFTANSKALADFAVAHPRAVVVGSTNNGRLANFWADRVHPGQPAALVVSFAELSPADPKLLERLRDADEVFAVLDRQTMNWIHGGTPVTTPLACWRQETTLVPSGTGLGNDLAALASLALGPVKPLAAAFEALSRPKPADVFRVSGADVMCRGG